MLDVLFHFHWADTHCGQFELMMKRENLRMCSVVSECDKERMRGGEG